MADVELAVHPQSTKGSHARFRARNGSSKEAKKHSIERDFNSTATEDGADFKDESVDIGLIQRRTYLLSAWIGDTNRSFNRFKGWIGLVVWAFNVVIHFGLDFYEAKFVFEVSWATCIGLFLVTLLACCYSMIKHSVPWFIKGLKKLKRDGHYPKTLRRVYLIFKYMPIVVVMFAVGAAMGQFGCYAYDGALRLSFSKLSNETGVVIPPGIDVLFNVLRATSLTHIFYGFCLILVFHMSLIFMIQSSMHEFNDRMGKLFRENPIQIAFPDAVNLFSARAKFVRDGSRRSSLVLTTLLVACSTSFVLNAYNFLFLKRFAIYVWFAIAPLIWVVAPLSGAAWATKTYLEYKFVVVNAWVDIPEEHELEADVHEYFHEQHSGRSRSPSPVSKMMNSGESNGVSAEKKQESTQVKVGFQNDGYRLDDTVKTIPMNTIANRPAGSRKNSEISLNCSVEDEMQKGISKAQFLEKTPEILLTNYDEGEDGVANPQVLCVAGLKRSRSDSALSVVENVEKTESSGAALTATSSYENMREDVPRSNVVRIDIESSHSSDTTCYNTQATSVSGLAPPCLPAGILSKTESADNNPSLPGSATHSEEEKPSVRLQVPSIEQSTGDASEHQSKPNLLSGIAKTFHQWRTKTKKKRKFNYEKYIIYLESILPTVGFSIGGVIITFNGIYTFIVVLSFLVGVFAQEAFFGN